MCFVCFVFFSWRGGGFCLGVWFGLGFFVCFVFFWFDLGFLCVFCVCVCMCVEFCLSVFFWLVGFVCFLIENGKAVNGGFPSSTRRKQDN